MTVVEFILIVSVLIYSFYRWATSKYDFFEKRGISFEKPFLIFGNMKGVFFRTESMFDSLIRFHRQFNTQIYGIFETRTPLIVLKDLDLIKQITVKDFDHFINHRTIIEPQDDLLFGSGLFSLKDQKWKDMRSTLTPAFTGSKMRLMLSLISEVCEESIKFLKTEHKINPQGLVLDMKDFFTRYTNDVIASTAFGIKINSFAERENGFYLMGKKITNFTGWLMIKFFLFSSFKTIMRLFRVKLFDEKFSKYFMNLVIDSMKYRSKHNIVRPDMISMLMEAQNPAEKSINHNWTDEEIVAQCFIFFVAGFETTAVLMCFASHELMENEDIQQRLFKEIEETKAKLDGKPLTYDVLQGMKYLDMIVSETMRKWPGAIVTDRVCTKPYELHADGKKIDVEVGDVLWINIAGLHHDPNNFPNPEKFDPERFSEDNKGNVNPYAYAAFGLGPRNCIGNRFALMEAKAILFHMVSEFEFKASAKTQIPIVMDEVGFQLKPKGGFWLKLVPRKANDK